MSMFPVLSEICSPVGLSPMIIAFILGWFMVRLTVVAAVVTTDNVILTDNVITTDNAITVSLVL